MAQHFAIVIRKDGTVPFDDDVDPDHKATMLGHLLEMGHSVKRNEDGTHYIESWSPPEPE